MATIINNQAELQGYVERKFDYIMCREGIFYITIQETLTGYQIFTWDTEPMITPKYNYWLTGEGAKQTLEIFAYELSLTFKPDWEDCLFEVEILSQAEDRCYRIPQKPHVFALQTPIDDIVSEDIEDKEGWPLIWPKLEFTIDLPDISFLRDAKKEELVKEYLRQLYGEEYNLPFYM